MIVITVKQYVWKQLQRIVLQCTSRCFMHLFTVPTIARQLLESYSKWLDAYWKHHEGIRELILTTGEGSSIHTADYMILGLYKCTSANVADSLRVSRNTALISIASYCTRYLLQALKTADITIHRSSCCSAWKFRVLPDMPFTTRKIVYLLYLMPEISRVL
jgi:hypothetical protein